MLFLFCVSGWSANNGLEHTDNRTKLAEDLQNTSALSTVVFQIDLVCHIVCIGMIAWFSVTVFECRYVHNDDWSEIKIEALYTRKTDYLDISSSPGKQDQITIRPLCEGHIPLQA